MKEKSKAFLMYSKYWLEGTEDMIAAEKGIYIDLLCHQHLRGNLPNDTRHLARLIGITHTTFIKTWKRIQHKFIEQPNGLINVKLRGVVGRSEMRDKKNKIIGIFGGLCRKSTAKKADVQNVKEKFNVSDFLNIPTERLTERLAKWFEKQVTTTHMSRPTTALTKVEKEARFRERALELNILHKLLTEEQLTEFCDHWTESNQNSNVLLCEKRETFDMRRRMKTWQRNNYSIKGNTSQLPNAWDKDYVYKHCQDPRHYMAYCQHLIKLGFRRRSRGQSEWYEKEQ